MEKEYNNKSFGGAVIKKIDFILKYLKSKDDIETILDYGCGPGLFKKHMTRMNEPYEIFEYEPGDPKKDFINGPKDCTICIDVMEHVEENYVDSVIKNIADHTKKYALFSIALNPAKKHLPDGRNAHITLKSHDWWLKKIKKHFSDVRYNPNPKIIERTLNVYCTK
jgi:2-polyprenyl-3-methyl-5-hydroxy-6-metoxy-1,4-benzoquinol methylase